LDLPYSLEEEEEVVVVVVVLWQNQSVQLIHTKEDRSIYKVMKK
jgi:hypothetical protein